MFEVTPTQRVNCGHNTRYHNWPTILFRRPALERASRPFQRNASIGLFSLAVIKKKMVSCISVYDRYFLSDAIKSRCFQRKLLYICMYTTIVSSKAHWSGRWVSGFSSISLLLLLCDAVFLILFGCWTAKSAPYYITSPVLCICFPRS